MILDIRNHPDRYVTLDELAAYWNVSVKTLKRYIEQGHLHAEDIHGQIKVRTSSVRQHEQRPVFESK